MFNAMMLTGRRSISASVIISTNQTSWNLIDSVFGGVAPAVPATVSITVNSGIVVTSMDLSGLPDGSAITLTNNGFIYGTGGAGGSGQGVFAETNL